MERIRAPKTLQMNTISTSDNRCENIDYTTKSLCKRKLLIDENGKEFCFYCSMIAGEDKKIKESAEKVLANKEVNKLMAAFQEKSLMNRDLAAASLKSYVPQHPSQQHALDMATKYVDSFDGVKGLILQGRPGLGKSHLASGIVKEIIQKKHTGLFISLPRLMTELKATYSKKSDLTEIEILSALQKVDLLVLDDLGVEMDGKKDEKTAWAKEKIYEVVDARIGLSTIYTTNFTVRELAEMYGERDFSRMVQYCEITKLEGQNYRLQKFK